MDDSLNHVLCWTFRTHESPVFKPGSTTFQISKQIDASETTHLKLKALPLTFVHIKHLAKTQANSTSIYKATLS